MSAESEIVAVWDGNATLKAQIPSDRLFLSVIPVENYETPFAVVVWAESSFEFTSCYRIETFPFQIVIYDTSAANAKTIGNLVDAAYEFQSIAAATVECRPVGKQLSYEPILINVQGPQYYSYTLRYELISVRDL